MLSSASVPAEERSAQFPWPLVEGSTPVWTGHGFSVDGRPHKILDFEAGESGWNEDLTTFHEEAAGEGTHPIDVASRRRARAALKRHLTHDSGKVIVLEAGCSSGFLLPELQHDWPSGTIIGSDYLPGPLLALAERQPTVPLIRFDLVQCPLPDASVDAVVLLNVLEHIERDDLAVQQVARILRPGGVAIIEVPAGPSLFDVYDRYLHHFRRYSPDQVSALCRQAGLRVLEQSHLGCLVYPAFAWVKRRNRRFLEAPEAVQRQVVEAAIKNTGGGSLLRWAMAIEEWLDPLVTYPVGIRSVAVARKRS